MSKLKTTTPAFAKATAGRQNSKLQEILNTLFKNRGIKTEKQRKEFFNSKHPGKITNKQSLSLRDKELGIREQELGKAVKRIKEAIKNKEKIIVYGDYDVDGICATAILWETLDKLGASALPHIPSRFTEGYGLNIESIKKLKEEDPKLGLIITVDHGIVAHEKVDFAKELGVDVIVVDHHEPGRTRPKAHAVVHTQKICASGVAWALAQALNSKVKSPARGEARQRRQESKLQLPPSLKLRRAGKTQKLTDDHICLVALGTVADMLPLVGINRSFVVHGVDVLRNTNRPGIKALCQEAGIIQKEIDTFHINFMLAPRLNAMGRVEHALDSLRLLCTRDKTRAEELAGKLGRTNRLRQEKTDYAVNHVNEKFAPSWNNGSLPKLIFVHHESYEEGVIGIVAGRLVDQYHRPSIVVSRGVESSKGSARSIRGVNIIDMIREVGGKLLVNAGGHPMAAGFTIKTEHVEFLAAELARRAGKEIKDDVLVKNTRVDCELSFGDISEELYEEIRKFAPFGYGNPEPTFLTRGVSVKDARLVGRANAHLKLILTSSSTYPPIQSSTFQAIGFKMGKWYNRITPEQPLDVVYCITLDEWNGGRRLQLKLREIQHGRT